ncbi:unnamed protein product [Knipowitschia caucasica]
MDDVVEEFLEEPCESDLKLCTKRQLIAIAEFYKVFIGDSTVLRSVLEDNLKKILFGMGILVSPVGLTFEQQKELLLVQVEAEREREIMRQEVELATLDIERQKLYLKRQEMQCSPRTEHTKEELSDLKLVPRFNGGGPETKALQFTGSEFPVVGIALKVMEVPCDTVLHCDFVQGEESMGVHPALPVDGATDLGQ